MKKEESREMRFREYLRDRRYPVLFWTAAMGVSEGVMLLFGSTGALQVFLLAIWAGAGAGILGYDYGRKREFYKELKERLGQLDEKYLVIEMLREPRFLEGRILYRSYVDILKSMNDEIERHERISSAFRSYVETWVHEIKIPIAGAKLIMHNNPGESSRKLKEQIGKVEAYVEQVLYYIRSEVPQNDYSIGNYPLAGAGGECGPGEPGQPDPERIPGAGGHRRDESQDRPQVACVHARGRSSAIQ